MRSHQPPPRSPVGPPLLSLALLLASCAAPPPALSWDAPAPAAPYRETLSAWTRSGERFEEMEGRLFVSATLLSPSFERARAAELAARLELTSAERRREEDGLVRRAQEQRLFFVALATQEHSHNDLRPRGSVFSAHLLVGEQVLPATWITESTTQEQLALRFAFPFLSPLHQGYWVSFPGSPSAEQVSLRVSGLPGAVTLSWDLRGEAPRAQGGAR